MKKLLFVAILAFLAQPSFAQITVDNTTMTVEQFVQNVLVGTGVTVSNIQYNGGAGNVVQERVGSFADPNADVGLSNGLILGSGSVAMAAQLNTSGSSSLGTGTGVGVDPDLASITPNTIYDECIVEFDFIPSGDTIAFNYVFASEEYDEYVCGSVNDAFGFFLSGPNPAGGNYTATNLAVIPDPNNPGSFTSTPVSINTVNLGVAGSSGTLSNCTNIDPNFANYNVFYTQNTTNTYEYDGKTVVLQAVAAVQCGQTYHIKLAIGDGGDGSFDSGVFLEAGSFSSSIIQVDVVTATGDTNIVEDCDSAILNLTRPDTSGSYTVHFDISGTATNGIDYSWIADSVTFLPGQSTVSIGINPLSDAINEGSESVIITVYTINPCGDTITSEGSIYIIDLPNLATHTSDTTLSCPVDTVPIFAWASGASPPYQYSWMDGQGNLIGNTDTLLVSGLIPATYYVVVSDSCNLVSILDSVQVGFNYTPLAITPINDTNVCPGYTVNLQSSVNGGVLPYTYSWSTGGTNANNAVTVNSDTTVIVSVTDACNTITVTDTVQITTQFPDLELEMSNDVILCPGESTVITATITGGLPNYVYQWESGLGNQSEITVSPSADEFFSVTITDACGINYLEDSVFVQATYVPMVVTVDSIPLTCHTDTFLLNALVENGRPPYIYGWNYGLQSGANIPAIIEANIEVVNPGTFSVVDDCGISVQVPFIPNVELCDVITYNIFSPNGDGLNDYLEFTSIEKFPQNNLKVFNRWGDLIYETDTYQNNWDGKDFPEGVYYYILSLNNKNNDVVKGSFTIVR